MCEGHSGNLKFVAHPAATAFNTRFIETNSNKATKMLIKVHLELINIAIQRIIKEIKLPLLFMWIEMTTLKKFTKYLYCFCNYFLRSLRKYIASDIRDRLRNLRHTNLNWLIIIDMEGRVVELGNLFSHTHVCVTSCTFGMRNDFNISHSSHTINR